MTQDELQKKHARFLDKVRQMRGVQKDYFKFRMRSYLERSKRLEREVDAMINEEVKAMKSGQQEINF